MPLPQTILNATSGDGHRSGVHSLIVAPGTQYMFSGDRQGCMKVRTHQLFQFHMRLMTLARRTAVTGMQPFAGDCHVACDNGILLHGSAQLGSSVQPQQQSFHALQTWYGSLMLAMSDSLLAGAGAVCAVQVWDLAQGVCVQTIARAHDNAITSILRWEQVSPLVGAMCVWQRRAAAVALNCEHPGAMAMYIHSMQCRRNSKWQH